MKWFRLLHSFWTRSLFQFDLDMMANNGFLCNFSHNNICLETNLRNFKDFHNLTKRSVAWKKKTSNIRYEEVSPVFSHSFRFYIHVFPTVLYMFLLTTYLLVHVRIWKQCIVGASLTRCDHPLSDH